MKVLLIAPNSRRKSSVNQIPLVTPPLNLMYLAEIINKENCNARILDAYALNMSDLETLNFVKKFEPEVILIPLYSKDLLTVFNLTSMFKKQNPNLIIILGSHHASNMPDAVLNEFHQVDYILRGEAEQTIINLLQSINQNNKLKNVKGLSYRKLNSKKIIHNKNQQVIKDLDIIPIPSRDLIVQKHYYSRLSKKNPLGVIITSRGCPNFCSFCSKLDNFHQYRMRSPENIILELQEILAHGAKSIEIYDESFTFDKKRCLKIIDLIKKEKMDFECRIRTRVDYVNQEILKKLKSINCNTISYGVESGNQRILDMNNKSLKINQIKKSFNITQQMKINILAFFLIGFPQDTPQTIQDTINLAKKLNPKYATFTRIRPFPGTQIYREAKKNHILEGDWGVNKTIPWVKLPWTRNIDDLNKYVDKAYREFYYRPKFIFDFFQNTIKDKNWSQLFYALKNSLRNIRDTNPEN